MPQLKSGFSAIVRSTLHVLVIALLISDTIEYRTHNSRKSEASKIFSEDKTDVDLNQKLSLKNLDISLPILSEDKPSDAKMASEVSGSSNEQSAE